MNSKASTFLTFILLFISSLSFAQIISGGGNGQASGKSVSPSEVTSGGFAGDVSLFTGTYNSSYTLGTVSTNSGISYTATMTHSSTYMSGDNLPHVSGIPYGEGWNLDVPTISVSTEDYNKYTIAEAYWRSQDPSQTEEYYDGDCKAAEEEGRLYWFAPNISIPGVASGRMVYKYRKDNSHVFVLHKFERYIEAHFTGTYWIVYLDDGTVYEFEATGVANRTASNQRVQSQCSGFGNGLVDENAGQSIADLVLPKTETLTWHCSQIKNKNLVGRINFKYERYGAFDFNKVFKQERTSYDINGKWFGGSNRPSLHKVYKDIFLVEINSSYERLLLNYEVFEPKAISNILNVNEDGVEAVDNLYAKKTVLEWGGLDGAENFDDWFRYKHLKRDNNLYEISPTNPYTGEQSGALESKHVRESISGTQVPFSHGFLESPRIQADPANMPLGDIYELESTIHTNWGSTSPRGDCLFDINLATGDNTTQPTGGGALGNSSGEVNTSDFNRTRGEAVYTTFNKAMKWYNFGTTNAPGGSSAYGDMVTSDLFVMPNLPDEYGGFNIQIGPANSDNRFDMESPTDLTNNDLDVCTSYYGRSSQIELLQPGDDMPNNFGIGLPWAMMSDFYAYMNPDFGLGYCDVASSGSNFWWHQGLLGQGNWDNTPTKAGDNIQLRNVKLVRYGKVPYMLKSVIKQVLNTGDIELDPSAYCADSTMDRYYRNISHLKLEYKHDTAPIYNTYVEVENGVDVTKVQSTSYFRNIFLLSRIIQLPADADSDTPMGDHPTTHFAYQQDNSAEIHFPNVTIDDDFYGVPGLSQFINSNFSVIKEVTDPLGKVTSINFAAPGFTDGSSYYTSRYEYRRRPHELKLNGPTGISKVYKQAPGYGFQVYMVVDNVKVEDRSGDKSWDYIFSGRTGRNDEITPLSRNFIYDWNLMGIRTGFSNTTVSGPSQGAGNAPRVEYTHNTSDLLWGKVNEVKTFDASGNLLSRSESDYEVVMAFEPATHRASMLRYQEWDYYDYYKDEYIDDDPPRPSLLANDYESIRIYNDTLRGWLKARIINDPNSGLFADWLNEDEDNAITDPPNLICPELDDPEDCHCANYDSLSVSNQSICQEYWSEYADWVSRRPLDAVDYFSKSHPDISTQGGQFDTPYFYESRYDAYIGKHKARYLYSYFIKKTEDRQATFDPSCSEGGSVETKTAYEYYDADYKGIPQSDDAFSQILQGDDTHLYYEPSWQLFRKHTSSSELPDAYTEEEFYYTYDLFNNATFHDNNHLLPDGLLKDLYNRKKIRTLAYETRVKSKAPGEDAITRSTYFIYKNDWRPEHSGAEFITLTENPCGEGWPCTGDDVPNDDDENGSWDVIYTDDHEPCYLYPHVPDGYDCPHEDSPAYWCQCGAVEAEEGPGEVPNDDSRNVDNFLGGKIYLSEVHSQVEAGGDEILTFNNTTIEPVFPHKHLKTNEILSRNLWGQVIREKNQREIVTHYDYGPVKVYTIPVCIKGEEEYDDLYSRNTSGQPIAVTVGAGISDDEDPLPDALTTFYEYNLDHTIAKITDPNGMELTYQYDEYKRMNAAYRNGDQIQGIVYDNWNNDTGLSFKLRASQNLVATTNFVSAPDSTGEGEGMWNTIAYVDPLGRNVANVRAGVLVEDNIYDIYDQPIIKLKPAGGGVPSVNFTGTDPAEHAEFLFDIPGRSRVLKSSKYGESLSGQHVVANEYCMSTANTLQTELTVAGQNKMPAGSVFFRTETTDEDGKTVISYSNAVGQSVATITNNGAYATVFVYDSFGNVKETYNPENQKTEYKYNYLGLLYEKVTLDAGTTTYGYDHSGNLLSENPASPRVVLYEYDSYGRMKRQIRTQTAYDANEGLPWVLTMDTGTDETTFGDYFNILNAVSSIPEKQWFYNNYDQSNIGTYSENAIPYLQNSITNALGRLVQSVSYDRQGETIEHKWLSYNDDGFLKWEMMQLKQPQDQLVRIDYPDYNLQGSYRVQNVDLKGDQVLDFQYRYVYDNQNRIKKVFANYDSPDTGNGNKIVEYAYDDVKDVVAWKKYFDTADPLEGQSCTGEEEVDHIDYAYDDRFRLTNIYSNLFDYTLMYDNDYVFIPGGTPTLNYNGNINSSIASYKTTEATNGTDAQIMGSPTSYMFTYDNLNRLTEADANVENSLDLSSAAKWGDAVYTYDKIGNFTNLNRWTYEGIDPIVEAHNYTYHYATGKNRLYKVTESGEADRDFNYDLDGNIIWDSKKQMTVGYGRANLPWGVTTVNPKGGETLSSYLYDAADARIFKTVTKGSETTQEYYIRSASGQELAVYNMSTDQMTWYIYGNERVAKIDQKEAVKSLTPTPGPCDPNPPECDGEMLAAQQNALIGIRSLMAQRTNVPTPTNLYRIRLCDGTELHLFEDELFALPGNYMVLQTIGITTQGQTFTILSNGNKKATITLDFLLLVRVDDENVYIDNYEPCIPPFCKNKEDGAESYPANSVDSSIIFSTSEGVPPFTDLRQNHPGSTYSLLRDGNYWPIIRVNPQVIPSEEGEWNLSYPGNIPQDAIITYFKVILVDTVVQQNGSGEAVFKYSLHNGTDFVPFNGGQTAVYPSIYSPDAVFELTPDELPTIAEIQNMKLVVRNENTYDTHYIDYVGAEIEYRFPCDCTQEPPRSSGATPGKQLTSLGDLNTAISNRTIADITFPTKLYRMKYYDNSEYNVLEQEMSIVEGGGTVMQRIDIENVNQLLSVEQNGISTQESFSNLINIRKSEVDVPVNQPCIKIEAEDPFNEPMEENANPEAPDLFFYVHDHLGNTRVLYHTEYDCESTEKSYILDHVVDYYPYGKVLREFVNGEVEKFLTTHHERDQETDLDYRGARFYDSDIGRFLSLDPLAADFADMSPYNYVLGNPVRYIDPDGRKADDIILVNKNGEELERIKKAGEDVIVTVLAEVEVTASPLPRGFAEYAAWMEQFNTRGLDLANGQTSPPIEGYMDRFLNGIRLEGGIRKVTIGESEFLVGEDGYIKMMLAPLTGTLPVSRGPATLKPGKFSGKSIPSPKGKSRRFSKDTRTKINEFGNDTGCHTCGSKSAGTKSGNFVPDHQPPNALTPDGGAQKLYPHCITCSRSQGGTIGGMKRSGKINK